MDSERCRCTPLSAAEFKGGRVSNNDVRTLPQGDSTGSSWHDGISGVKHTWFELERQRSYRVLVCD